MLWLGEEFLHVIVIVITKSQQPLVNLVFIEVLNYIILFGTLNHCVCSCADDEDQKLWFISYICVLCMWSVRSSLLIESTDSMMSSPLDE